MGYIRAISEPTTEPVSLQEAKDWLGVSTTSFDAMLTGLIIAAREKVETETNRTLASRNFLLVMDSFPYYVDTVQSQQAYPPNYYSAPRYSTTLWNYSQMIKLPRSPLSSMDVHIDYTGTDGNNHTIHAGTDFLVDPVSEQPRLFPLPGQMWPPVLYTPNAVRIYFAAGFAHVSEDDPAGVVTEAPPSVPDPPQQAASYALALNIPQSLRVAMLMLVAHYFENRWAVSTARLAEVPMGVKSICWNNMAIDFASTRG